MLTFKKDKNKKKNKKKKKDETSYTKFQATSLIKKIVKSGFIRTTKHAKDRMKERDITNQDILWAFKYGKVIDEPEPDIKTGYWKYKIIGNAIDSDDLKITVVINEKENYLLVITVFLGDKK